MREVSVAITVDFEDFSYDLGRKLGILQNVRSREYALSSSYDYFMDFMNKKFKIYQSTFFCTGILAKTHSNLIKRISDDGHEIACHYFYHDDLNKDSITAARKNLIEAKDTLQQASGQEIIGFRAPRFSLDKLNIQHLELVSELFRYDSSLHFSNTNELMEWEQLNCFEDFTELPVASQKLYVFMPKIKLGGSYLKLFPAQLVKKAIINTHDSGLLPIVYLHPYDFLPTSEFNLNIDELKTLGFRKCWYTYFRQRQWTSLGNSFISSNLSAISDGFNNVGPLKILL
tara:strand:+ start:926 stop:1783 length:858 start_codon:yes stop_codon:yes gene_type:complete